LSATVIGLEAKLIHVEVHFSKGKSRFYIVGLPDKACSESKERVTAIIKNYLGHRLPAGTFTVNLSPADIMKTGPVYDLPITIGILDCLGMISFNPQYKLLIGELSLDGKTHHTNAILPIADLARRRKIKEIYIPQINSKEASLIPDIDIIPVKNLCQLINHINNKKSISKYNKTKDRLHNDSKHSSYDMSLIKGNEHAKRAIEIASTGSHNMLMVGPPGSGKTLLARTIPTILPTITIEESLEITKIYSVAGLLSKKNNSIKTRPFRKPHHTTSHVALVGGGTIPKPGEISLAHRGILFLDEFSEFSNRAIEALRQPLEDGTITISRAKGSLTFPAKIMLVAAMNPCKCGWLGDGKHKCTCTPSEIIRYKKKISGPVLDRIDMRINVKRVEYNELNSNIEGTSSCLMKKNIQKARDIQLNRFKNLKIVSNSEMNQKEIKEFIHISKSSKNLLKKAMESINLSARGYFRLQKVARTIADLESSYNIKKKHLAEALSFRIEE